MKKFQNVIDLLIETNEKLLNKEIDIETAKAIAQNTQVIINAAKVTLEFAKFTNDTNNFFFGGESIDVTLKKIKIGNKKPYQL